MVEAETGMGARMGTRAVLEAVAKVIAKVGTLMLGGNAQTTPQAKELTRWAIKDGSCGTTDVLMLQGGMLVVACHTGWTGNTSRGATQTLQLLPPFVEHAQIAEQLSAIGSLHLLLVKATAMR